MKCRINNLKKYLVIEFKKKKTIIFTLCGALRTLCTLFNWLLNTVEVRNVNDGGRAGSGKLTLENGSVSSRYCTRHSNVVEFPFNPALSLNVLVVDEASEEFDIMFDIRTNSF